MSGYDLAYIALAVREVAAVEEVLGVDLELTRYDVEAPGGAAVAYGVGRTALVLFEKGHPFLTGNVETGVDHIALATQDPDEEIRKHGLPADERQTPDGVKGARQAAVDPGIAGLALRFCTPLGPSGDASRFVQRVDHIGIASADNAAAEQLYVNRLGCPLESRQTDMEVRLAVESFTSDKYGAIYHTRPPEPVGGLRVSFVTTGDCELEFLQDFDPSHGAEVLHGSAGTTKQDQGAIGRFIARHGPGLHHVALKTDDIDGALAHLAGRGRRMIDIVGRPGSRRSRIGFLHPAALGGVLLHFVERREIGHAET
ncbi:MAG: VOC family protein [Methyloligellaceae bacterium]